MEPPQRRSIFPYVLVLGLVVVVASVTARHLGPGEPSGDAAVPTPATTSPALPRTATEPAPPTGVADGDRARPTSALPNLTPAESTVPVDLADDASLPSVRPSVPRISARPKASRPKRGAAVTDTTSFEGDRLPVDSPYDLPPMVELRILGEAHRPAPGLRNYVLRLRSLAFSPTTRAGVRDGRPSAAALALAVRLSRVESPLLVHRARGGRLRVQATSLEGTREIVRAARGAAGVSLALRPVRRDFADVAQTAADARSSEIGAKVVALALEQVGMPYSWGGGNANGPSTGTCAGYTGSIQPCPATRTVGFDCSGLTLYAYAQLGIALDHYAAFQWLEGRRIASTDLMPGDLVFFSPKTDGPGHMGMYVGSGRFVHAPRTGDFVKISNLSEYARSYMGAVRPY